MSDHSSPESPVPLKTQEDTLFEEQALENESVAVERFHPGRTKYWAIALSIVLLIVGGGFGWRWWQSRASNAQPAPGAAGQPQGIPVKLATVETATVEEASEFVGSLQAARRVVIKPEIEGRVSQILVSEGDRVPAGKTLVQLSPDKRQAEAASVLQSVNAARATSANAASQIKALEAERASTVAELELQQENYRRTSTLVGQGALARAELDRVTRDRRAAQAALNAITQRIQAAQSTQAQAQAGLQQAQANVDLANAELKDATIVAPIAGVVGAIPVKLGDVVSSSDTLTTIIQNQSLEIELSIPLERAPDLRLGQTVEGTNSQGKLLGTGTISFISPQVNSSSQSILIKARFDNSQGQLRDGQFIQARVVWDEKPGVLIPTTAISRLGGANFVFVAQRKGESTLIAQQKPVKLGDIQGNNYQVIEGLQPGERIVVSGILNLSNGAPIIPESKN
ncbi:efflux RND transporter periplasmic adaptor subunit [Cyanobacteria bacterium FACHB-472]|nr:efflux RND transporter periplasmic adaptor subunit [Cyanobacteria bacterium FACHB-472]